MSSHTQTAVVLVTHEASAKQYLTNCCAALRAQTLPADRFTLFIVNNGIPSAQEAILQSAAPQARIVRNAKNLGWSGGNNSAIRTILQEKFDYVVLLNVDTVADPTWLEELVRAADDRQDLQILQSKLLLYGTDRINSLGNRIQFLGYGYCLGYGEPVSTTPVPARIDYASGAAMLIKREVFERVGLLREEYFMYYDDMEFCWRARLAGYEVGLAEKSVCQHTYSFTQRIHWLYHLERNRLLTILSMEKLPTLFLIAPPLVIAEGVLLLYFFTRGWGNTALRLVQYFLRPSTWSVIVQHRRQVGRLRRKRDAEIVRLFCGKIVFAEVNQPLLRYLFNPLLSIYWAIVKRLIVW